jgi:c-di-GMP-binding flagellar brake protein YcgR
MGVRGNTGENRMDISYEQERREFVRVKVEVPVSFKFLCKTKQEPEMAQIYTGVTSNLSGGGLLLVGKIPVLAWVPDLLMQKIVVGINLHLPAEDMPMKALTRVAWIETIDETSLQSAFGLRFKEITTADRDKIFKFVIRAQMPS